MVGCVVSFNIYDLKHTGVIEKDEVYHLLLALLHENPDLRLPKEAVGDLVDRVRGAVVFSPAWQSHQDCPSAVLDS